MVVNEGTEYTAATNVAHVTGSVGVGAVLAAIFAMSAVAVCAAKCYKRMIWRANENPPTTVIQQIQRSSSQDSSAGSQRSSVHSRGGRGGGVDGGDASDQRKTPPSDAFSARPFSPALPMTTSGRDGAVITGKGGNSASVGWRQYDAEWRAHFKSTTQHLPCTYQTEQRCASGRSTPTPLHRGNYWSSTSHRQQGNSAALATPPHRRSLPAALAYGAPNAQNRGGGGGGGGGGGEQESRDVKKEITEFIHEKLDRMMTGNTFNQNHNNHNHNNNPNDVNNHHNIHHNHHINSGKGEQVYLPSKEEEGGEEFLASNEKMKNKRANLKIEFLEQEEIDAGMENFDSMASRIESPNSDLIPSTSVTPTTTTTTTTTTTPINEGEKSDGEKQNPKLGCLHYSIKYHQFKQMLQVHINRAEGLPSCDRISNRWDDDEKQMANRRTEADPFIKLQILPEKRLKVKTRVMKRTRDPIYEETFSFYGISPEKIRRLSLHFAIFSFDRFSHDNVIGEVFHSLAEVDLSGKDPAAIVQEISPRSLKRINQNKGEVLISLCHEPTANKLIVGVLKAKDLPSVDFTKTADPYVKLQLTHSGQKTKKKTEVKKQTTNPVFNESFSFDVPNEGLKDVQLEVMICNWDRVTKHAPVGTLCFSLQSQVSATTMTTATRGNSSCLESKTAANLSNDDGKEALSFQHFCEASQNPRKAVAKWHAF